jgi:large subunit ribosomal protein L7/L12
MAEFSGAVTELGDKIATLTLVQAVELKNYLKEKYNIEPAAGGVVMAGPAAGGAAATPDAPKAEPTEFNVILESADAAKKIQVIKVVREIAGLGLAEAKAFVEGAPKTVKENVDKKTAEDLKKKIEDAGGKIAIKPAG